MLSHVTFVLGGASSGKSAIAERIVANIGIPRTYIATAQAFDDEMRQKIARHRAARAEGGWRTVEEPHDLAGVLDRLPEDGAALVDCLTLWISNRLLAGADADAEADALIAALARARCPICLVSNEVGQGVVPDTALGRRFRQVQGRLNRLVAARADRVVGVMAGLPFALKGGMPPGLG